MSLFRGVQLVVGGGNYTELNFVFRISYYNHMYFIFYNDGYLFILYTLYFSHYSELFVLISIDEEVYCKLACNYNITLNLREKIIKLKHFNSINVSVIWWVSRVKRLQIVKISFSSPNKKVSYSEVSAIQRCFLAGLHSHTIIHKSIKWQLLLINLYI